MFVFSFDRASDVFFAVCIFVVDNKPLYVLD